MTIHTPSRKLITAGVVISICVGLFTPPVVFAQRRGRTVLIEGLIQKVDRQSREITLWEFRNGDSTWTLQVPGTTNMRKLQVGELVLVETDGSRRVASRIRKLPPREGDKAYEEAVRRLEAETGTKAE
ncbi:MAG: hypothetical protein ACE5K9_05875 [Candidatus Methylomirabilales bacterium]